MASVNYLATFLAAVASMIIGFLWYGPLFGKQWMSLMGYKKKDMDKAKANGMGRAYIANFLASVVSAIILAILIAMTGAVTIPQGILIGFLVWLGFIATTMIGGILWEGKPFALYLLNITYQLVNLLVMGAIIGALR